MDCPECGEELYYSRGLPNIYICDECGEYYFPWKLKEVEDE